MITLSLNGRNFQLIIPLPSSKRKNKETFKLAIHIKLHSAEILIIDCIVFIVPKLLYCIHFCYYT